MTVGVAFVAVCLQVGGNLGFQRRYEHPACSLVGDLVEQGAPVCFFPHLGAEDPQHGCRLLPPAPLGAAVDQLGRYAAGVTGSTIHNFRSYLVDRIGRGTLTVVEAAQVLGLSTRQVRRLRRAVEERGSKAVVHGNTGRAPAHRLAEAVRAQVVELRRTKYAGFNDHHFAEKLREVEQLAVARPSVQRILRAAGIGPPRRRCAPNRIPRRWGGRCTRWRSRSSLRCRHRRRDAWNGYGPRCKIG